MAKEYKLSYTAEEIDRKLGMIVGLDSTLSVDGEAANAKSVGDAVSRIKQNLDYVTPQDYGAVGDGVTDDTDAFSAALAASDNVFVPEGSYVITNAIQIAQYKTLRGAGKKTILVASSPKDFIKLNAYTTISNFTIRVMSSVFDGSVIKVSSDTLTGVNFNGSANTNINISDIDVMWDSMATASPYTQKAVIEISCPENFKNYKGSNHSGFWGVRISNVYSLANDNTNVGYFLKGYASTSCWITGCTVDNCEARGVRWFAFEHSSDEDFSNLSQTIGIDELSLIRCQQQACNGYTKGFVFCRKGQHTQLTNCIPWDWHYAVGGFQKHPYCLEYDDLFATTPNGTKLTITPKAEAAKYAGIKTDGTAVGAEWHHEYIVSKNTGADMINIDVIPRQLSFKNNTYGACIFKTDELSRLLGAGSSHYHVHFQFFDKDYILKTVNVRLDEVTPTISVDYPLYEHTKIGYVKTDTEFMLYVYSTHDSATFVYSYALSMPLYSYYSTGGNIQLNYHRTINTFALPAEELYLLEVPSDMVQITNVSTTLGRYAVPNTETLTLTGIDVNGNSHTWKIYGKGVS